MSFEAVEAFYKRLSEDPIFYQELQNSSTKEDCRAIVQAAGYNFTQSELTDYTATFLEMSTSDAKLTRLGSQELAKVVGGALALTRSTVVIPPYGHVPFEQ